KPTNALALEFEVPFGATPEEEQAMAEAFIAAVKAFIVSGREPDEGLPEIVPGGGRPIEDTGPQPGGATGDGDWGTEGLPGIKLPAGDWETLIVSGGQGPIDDWGDWKDPRAMVANALNLAHAVAANRHASGRGVLRTLNVLRGLDSAVRHVGFGK
ncbi:MAG TPA: hypothetical protein VJT50_15290, partial [Pyrinomonadaceae bacterium]|nr:hypothetical protein [Pyrinomonadaceae bacterium]